mgnify:CR=1 FL=1
MFAGRSPDGTIYGAWTCKQPDDPDHPGIEELPDDHPDVLAFINRPEPTLKDVVDQLLDLPPARRALLKAELAKP